MVTIATPKIEACFWKTSFGCFPSKSHQNATFLCCFHEDCPKCSLLWKFGLDSPLEGDNFFLLQNKSGGYILRCRKNQTNERMASGVSRSLKPRCQGDQPTVTIFVSQSFSCWTTLNLAILPPWGSNNGVIRLGYYTLSEKLTLLIFNKGNKVFDFWIGIPSQSSENINHLKTLTIVSMETKVVSKDSFLDKLSEKISLEWILRGLIGFLLGLFHTARGTIY